MALEERIFGAIRDRILVPEHVAYVVEGAMAMVEERLQGGTLAPDADRLAELEEELAALRRAAARTGRARDVSGLLAELEAERQEILRPAATSAPIHIGRDTLRRLIEPHVLEMRAAFLGSPELARSAFRALLAGRRMRVGPDPERRFRVEGIFELALEAADARASEGHRASAIRGSGGALRNARRLPVPAFELAA